MTSRLLVDKIEGKSTSGTIQMPAGHVVQTSLHTFSNETISTSDSDVDLTGSSHTFTPKFASSLLIISFSVHVQMNRDTNQQGCTINCVVDSSNISHSNADFENYQKLNGSGGVNNYIRTHKEVSTSASNTNAKTIKLVGRPYATGDNGAMKVNPSANFTSSIKIQEIAQ